MIKVGELPPHKHRGRTEGQETLRSSFVEIVTTQIIAVGSGSPFGGGGQTVRSAEPKTAQYQIQLPPHVHSFITDDGEGLTGRPEPDNNMPPYLVVSICERKNM
jgi:hypothetical protein